MALGAAVHTSDGFAFLPESVGVVSCMWFAIVLIDAAAAEESLEALLIDSFMDGQVALSAFEVPCRLLKSVFIRSLWVLLLAFKEMIVLARVSFWPTGLLGRRSGSGASCASSSQSCCKMPFNDLHCEPLVYSSVARVALVAASVWFPLVFVGLPGELALPDEPFLVLFGVVPCTSDGLLVEVVLGVLVNLLQACSCLLVDPHMVLV